jgi:hypothetical protein
MFNRKYAYVIIGLFTGAGKGQVGRDVRQITASRGMIEHAIDERTWEMEAKILLGAILSSTMLVAVWSCGDDDDGQASDADADNDTDADSDADGDTDTGTESNSETAFSCEAFCVKKLECYPETTSEACLEACGSYSGEEVDCLGGCSSSFECTQWKDCVMDCLYPPGDVPATRDSTKHVAG